MAARAVTATSTPVATAPADPFDRDHLYNSRRSFIIAEAASVFREKGYARTSIEDIAARLRVTKTALYYYFKSKEEILYECFKSALDSADALLEQAEREGKSGRERIELSIRSFLTGGLGSELQVIAIRERRTLSPQLREKLGKRRLARRDRLRQIVVDGIADGSIRPCNPTVVVSVWAGTISWLMENYRADGELSAADLAEAVIAIFMDGLGPR